MKTTNHYPIHEWYDNNNYTHLDYPPLAGYTHYYMAAIYKHYDLQGFESQARFGGVEKTPPVKLAMRRSILFTNLVSYFPVVIFMVMQHMKAFSRFVRMATILLFLVFPAYAFIEFTNTQVNGPHLALLLLCIHCLITGKLLKATFFFTLSACYKHVVGPFVFPVGVFILAKEWQAINSCSKLTSRFKKFILLAWRAFLHAAVGVSTLVIVCLPLLVRPPAFHNMVKVITHINFRGFINPCPSFWNIFKDFVGREKAEEILLPYIPLIFYFFLAVTFIMAPFMFKKPTKDLFCAGFNIFGITLYLFGFSIHEKHIHYMLMTLILNPWEYRRYIAFVLVLSTWSMLPTACFDSNDLLLWEYGTGFITYIVLYEKRLLLFKEPLAGSEAEQKGFIIRAINFFNTHAKKLLAGSFLSMFSVLTAYVITTKQEIYQCTYGSYYEDTSVKIIFLWMMVYYVYQWLVFFKIYYYYPDTDSETLEKIKEIARA